MEPMIGLMLGLLGGGAAGFFTLRSLSSKRAQVVVDEANKTADLTVKEAKLTAQRLTSEAETKSTSMIERANAAVEKSKIDNERIKNEKIQQEIPSI